MSSKRSYPPVVRHAAQLLGADVRAARLERDWTVAHLAERAQVSPRTVLKVEHGDPSVALGTALDCASLVGVPLYYDDERRLAAEAAQKRAPLIGRRARSAAAPEVDLDF